MEIYVCWNSMAPVVLPAELDTLHRDYTRVYTWYPEMKTMAVAITSRASGISWDCVYTQPALLDPNDMISVVHAPRWHGLPTDEIRRLRASWPNFLHIRFRSPVQVFRDIAPSTYLYMLQDQLTELQVLQARIRMLGVRAREFRLALAMGGHARLGRGSPVYLLTHEVLDKHVLPLVFKG